MSEHPEQPMLPAEEPYLWDGSGPVDPTVARVERELAVLSLQRGELRESARPRVVNRMVAAAALLLVVGAAAWWALRSGGSRGVPTEVAGATWRVAVLPGLRIGDEVASKGGERVRRVEVGENASGELRTNAGSTFRLGAGCVVDLVEEVPQPTLRLVTGEISGDVTGPDAPVAVIAGSWEALVHGRAAIAYREHPAQGPRMAVDAGWVEIFESGGKSVRRPVRLAAGEQASAEDLGGRRPVRSSASPAMAKAYEAFQLARSGKFDPKSRMAMLSEVLNSAGIESTPWLWNLAWDVSRDDRVRIIARLDELVPAKLASTREARADLDPASMDELWHAIVAQADEVRRERK